MCPALLLVLNQWQIPDVAVRLHFVAVARDRQPLSASGTPQHDRQESNLPGGSRHALAGAAITGSAAAGQTARTESSARLGAASAAAAESVGPPAYAERCLVKESYACLRAYPHWAMEYLYARLFVQHPHLRSLFPLSMEQTRSATFEMLTRLVGGLDNERETEELLGRLGRSHRKFGVLDKHHQPFFDALLAAAEQLAGPAWTAQADAAWRSVLGYFAATMQAAAARDAKEQPAWWVGEIVQHDRRTPTIAVLTIRPDRPIGYRPGQYIWLQVPRWPRIWRSYSIANAPRGNGLIDIHVRAVPGGIVSTTLVSHCRAGDMVTLGAPAGDLAVSPDTDRDLVCVAGGTGLAPVKALVEAVVGGARQGRRRAVTIYVGARHSDELYDMRDLETLRLAYPPLTLVPVVERELEFAGRIGRLPEVVRSHPSFRDTDVYVGGPAGLISATARALSGRVPAGHLHHDSLAALRAADRPDTAEQLRD